jgi:hypothetical protein
MKKSFPEYYKLSEAGFSQLWKDATFIFDTNVLLNLYRYQSPTRESLLQVMDKLSKRVWIPHHVALEFQRNRLTVISEQDNKFGEVKKIVSEVRDQLESRLETLQLKTRHSHIDPDKIIADVKKAEEEYLKYLDGLKKQSLQVSSEDQIRDKIDILFEGKVGTAPKSQKDVDDLYEDGEKRYANKIPPGYKDSKKENKEDECYTHSGILYKRKFGDLVIWQQIMQYSKEKQLKDVIYITDDGKSDWWLTMSGKTIGVRPELTSEIMKKSGVERFHVYNTESFLQFANKYVGANVTDAALDEVRQVSERTAWINYLSVQRKGAMVDRAIINWLVAEFDYVEQRKFGFPDVIAHRNSKKFGFDVKVSNSMQSAMLGLTEAFVTADAIGNALGLEETALIFVLPESPDTRHLDTLIAALRNLKTQRTKVIFGVVEQGRGEESLIFVPKLEMNPSVYGVDAEAN